MSAYQGGDVLAGWDEVAPGRGRRARHVSGILPALAIVASGGLAGGFLGVLLARHWRALGAAVGTLAGAGAAVVGVNLRSGRD